MADVQTVAGHKQRGVRRGKKLSTRVDLTPMVDLGFLLITFFIFTSALSRPAAMRLVLPDTGTGAVTAASKTVSILLGDGHVYYYYGDSVLQLHATDLSPKGLRQVLSDKKRLVAQQYGNGDETVVLVKPTPDASYGDIVQTLDELHINLIKRYVLTDTDPDESASLEEIIK